MNKKPKFDLLREAAKLAASMPSPVPARTETLSEEDAILANAIKVVEQKNATTSTDGGAPAAPNTDDKGVFGNRQIEFTQDVYHIPKNLSGDKSQPVGLLTQSDLTNYVVYRKGDRLTFRYRDGDAGACKYEAKRNGEEEYKCDFDWSDGLIQELIDEGASKLVN